MRGIFLTIILVFGAGCGKPTPANDSNDENKFGGGARNPDSFYAKNLMRTSWCRDYFIESRRYEERYLFDRSGGFSFKVFALSNGGRRGSAIENTRGSWGLDKQELRIKVGNSKLLMRVTEDPDFPNDIDRGCLFDSEAPSDCIEIYSCS